MTSLLLGSISTLVDTSELQREAFNEAFAKHDLGWRWERDEYRSMLAGNGGAERIAGHARERGQDVDVPAVHATKSEIFQRMLRERGATPRAGVVDTIHEAREAGWQVALVTTTAPANLEALSAALGDHLAFGETFDLVTDVDDVDEAKPAADVYAHALRVLGETAGSAVAVEDNPGGVTSATGAGIACLAFPNENTQDLDFAGAVGRLDALTFADLHSHSAG